MKKISGFKLSFSPPEEFYEAKQKNKMKIAQFKIEVDFVKEMLKDEGI